MVYASRIVAECGGGGDESHGTVGKFVHPLFEHPTIWEPCLILNLRTRVAEFAWPLGGFETV